MTKKTFAKTILLTGAAVLALSLPLAAQEVPAGAKERGYFLLPELHEMVPAERVAMDAFMKSVVAEPVASTRTFDKPLRIALMFPSLETSDAWARLNISTRKRLEELAVHLDAVAVGVVEVDRPGVAVVDLLDDLTFSSTRGHRSLEAVKVNHHQVEGWNAVLL